MKGTKRTSIWRFLRAFWYFFKHYSFTTIVVYALMIPLFSWLGAGILRWSQIPYLSYDNVGAVAQTHPWAMVALVGLLLVMMIAIYLQFSYLLLMVAYQRKHQRPTIRQILGELTHRLPRLSVGTFGFFILYFLLIVPFGGNFINTPLLAKVQVPEFIVEFILTKPLLTGLLVVAYVAGYYFGNRLLLVIPILMFERTTVRRAVRQSWERTWGRFWWITVRLIGIIANIAVLYALMLGAFYGGQRWFDGQGHTVALTAAIINFNLLSLVSYTISILATVWVLDLSVQLMSMYDAQALTDLPDLPVVKAKTWWRIAVPVAVTVVAITMAGYGYSYFAGLLIVDPQTISHRGVDDGNGIQNTVGALAKTHKEHPAYVEMDIQETRDHKFVVMHDPNLSGLAGENRAVAKQSLASLTQTQIHENGEQAQIDSFDAYLQAAHDMHQKLLVEIKMNRGQDRHALVKRFVSRYSDSLLAHHDIIHSLDYDIVEQLKTQRPQLTVGYILPYNFVGLPQTKADFYTMEYTTLNDRFVSSAHRQNKKVFAWTVNDPDNMKKVMAMDVDGVITDQLGTLKAQIKQQQGDRDYANQLFEYGTQNINEYQ